MQIMFVRHARLLGDFRDYAKISMDVMNQYLMDEIDPQDIDLTYNVDLLRSRIDLRKRTVILYSPNMRTRKTAELIQSLIGNDTKIVEEKRLKEIRFDYPLLNDSKRYFRENLIYTRERVLTSLFVGNGTKPFRECVHSMEDLILELKYHYQEKDQVILVTHGFLMRTLPFVFNNQVISTDNLLKVEVPDYLSPYEMEVQT